LWGIRSASPARVRGRMGAVAGVAVKMTLPDWM